MDRCFDFHQINASRMNEINECFVFSSCQAPCALANKMLTTFNGQEFVVVVVIGWLKGIISDLFVLCVVCSPSIYGF
jgi:hypothetical protein